jgi:hypothetical protein
VRVREREKVERETAGERRERRLKFKYVYNIVRE